MAAQNKAEAYKLIVKTLWMVSLYSTVLSIAGWIAYIFEIIGDDIEIVVMIFSFIVTPLNWIALWRFKASAKKAALS